MRRAALVAVLIAVCVAVSAVPAFAFDETTSAASGPWTEANCGRCHMPWTDAIYDGYAIHGGYSSTSKKCDRCHEVHVAAAASLLPSATIQATCFTCHDGTQGRGVYGAIAARGLSVGAVHRNETTNVVPGGNASTGGSATMSFGGSGGTLSCDDCHSPHGASTVATFPGDRDRTASFSMTYDTNRLLKKRPGGVATATPVYGSDWCGACHKGRMSGVGIHTHPVESSATAGVDAYHYGRVPLVTGSVPTSRTVLGAMGRTNTGYLMPLPRTSDQAGHGPLCQQCHEDARSVGTLDANGRATATAFIINNPGDGVNVGDNPRFQNFPHEATNVRFLVEPGDDLCMNCHPPSLLP